MKKINLDKSEFYFLCIMFFIFFAISIILPFNNAPDESARYLVSQFIYNHMSLPMGNDLEVMIPNWGISYAFQPILSYIISGFFMKVTSILINDGFTLLVSARFASVVFSTITIYFTIRISKILFNSYSRWVFVSLVSTFPMFVFVSTYVNSDSLGMTSTSIIIYAWLLGLKNNWNRSSLIYLTIGMCLCGLSYQNAYGFLLTSILLFVIELVKKIYKRADYVLFLKKGFIVACVTFLIGGSTYIRNYFLYNGDFMGSTPQIEMAEKYAVSELKPSQKYTLAEDNISIPTMLYNLSWLKTSYKSFIGVFGYMNVEMPKGYYNLYNTIFIIGICGLIIQIKQLLKRHSYKNIVFNVLMFANVLIAILLSFVYSYSKDFQPQGRYCLPLLIPLMYFITKGILYFDKYIKEEYKATGKVMISCGFVLMSLSLLISVFIKVYV